MSIGLRIITGSALAFLATAALVWQESALARVRKENRALAEEAGTLASLRSERDQLAEQARLDEANARSARDRTELQRLRKEVDSMRGRHTGPSAAGVSEAPSASVRRRAPGAPITLRDVQDVGTATGEDLLQTFMWAMRTGNVKRVRELGDWSAEGSEDAAEEMTRDISKFAGSDEVVRDSASMTFRVLRQVPLDDGDMALITDVRHGNDNHRAAQRIRRAENGWKIVMGPGGPEEVQLEDDLMGD